MARVVCVNINVDIHIKSSVPQTTRVYLSIHVCTSVHVCPCVCVVCCSPRLDYFITCSLSLSHLASLLVPLISLFRNAQPVYLWSFNIKRKIGESHASHESLRLIPASLAHSLCLSLFFSCRVFLCVRNSKDTPLVSKYKLILNINWQ